ncbi:MAG: M16 family metallopeptidase [Planctomycetota bacterium]
MTSERSQTARERTPRAEKAGAKIEEHRLANGLTVILAARHLDPVVAVMLWYKVGARDEEEREAGVSHFLEHMMFKGSRRFGKGEIDRITTTLGGSNNAFTTADHTAYWFEFASDRWEKALEIEADRMRQLLLDPAEFAAEKAVVLEELAMGDDDPWRTLTQQLQLVLFARHPYRRPVIGFPDALQALDVAAMRSYYERHYHPGNAALVVCGDIEPKAALALVRKHFESIPAGAPRNAPYRPPMSEPKGEQRVQIAWDDRGARLVMAWPTALVGTDEDYAFDIVSTVLTGGRTSRLHRRLVLEQGLATSISSHNDTRLDAGVFWIFAECAQGVAPQKLEAAIDREIARVSKELVPAKELDRSKRILLSSEAYDNETVSDLAEEIGEFAADAHWKLALEAPDRIRNTTAPSVRDVCARLLRSERRVVGWCLPRAAAPRRAKKRRRSKGSA